MPDARRSASGTDDNMETVITRDTDILREYLAALDARERGMSPFARLAATIKLANLRRHLDTAQIESTDEDIAALRREIDERTQRSVIRRLQARPWGARVAIFLLLVVIQQLALALVILATSIFVRLSPVPKRWNPILPHEDPGYLLVFCFFFFFATPMLATLVWFGGRFFRSWRKTLPVTLLIILISVIGTYLVFRNTEQRNPVRYHTSLEQLAAAREGANVTGYRQWVAANWLLSDPKFQRDYETYLRNGPGRRIIAQIYPEGNPADDAAWRTPNEKDPLQAPSLQAMNDYLSSGQDLDGFREWLSYYLDRNRIYSQDRIDREVATLTGQPNQTYLGLWQVEPYLKERDQHLYRAYLGEMGRKMRLWGLASLGLYALAFLVAFLSGPTITMWQRRTARGSAKRPVSAYAPDDAANTTTRLTYEWFPERTEITTPPFFDTPLRLLGRVHRNFMRLAVVTIIFVFAFWAVIYGMALSSNRPNPATQVGLMRSFLLVGNRQRNYVPPSSGMASASYTTVYRAGTDAPPANDPTGARIAGVQAQIDESDYQNNKRFKEQYQTLAATQTDVNSLKNTAAQLQTTTTGLPQQISQAGAQADAKAGQALGEAASAKQMAQTIEQQSSTNLKELEGRIARANDELSRIEAQSSGLGSRTDKLETDMINLAKQLEARTDELNNRTAKEREDQAARIANLQSVAFNSITSELTASVDELDRRVTSNIYRFFNKGEAQREADGLRQRIDGVIAQLSGFTSDQAKQTVTQLQQLRSRVDEIAARVK